MHKNIDDETRWRVILLYKEKMTLRKISEKTGVGLSTIYKIIKKYNNHGVIKHMGNNGRTSKLSTRLATYILNQNDQNSFLSTRKMVEKIKSECDITISHTSIKNYLNMLEIRAYKPCLKPLLKQNHIHARYIASRRWVKMPENTLKTMIFSDESKFNLYNNDGSPNVWRTKSAKLDPKNIRKTIKFGGGSVMVWGCFSYYGVGELRFIDTKMDAVYYCNMLSNSLFASAEKMGLREYIFVQDNDPKHTSRLAKEFFMENNINVEPWPAQSPDCNPIEHLWAIIKRRIGTKTFKKKTELKEAIIQEWNSITPEMCRRLALDFKKTALLVYRAKGGYINK